MYVFFRGGSSTTNELKCIEFYQTGTERGEKSSIATLPILPKMYTRFLEPQSYFLLKVAMSEYLRPVSLFHFRHLFKFPIWYYSTSIHHQFTALLKAKVSSQPSFQRELSSKNNRDITRILAFNNNKCGNLN